jgi:thiol:disulfide interchange protein DsbD
LGLGLPFLVLGTFSGLIIHLPKAGPWMERFKLLTGYLLFGAAAYYLRPILSTKVSHILQYSVVIIGASHLGAFAEKTTSQIGRIVKGILFAALLVGAYGVAIEVFNMQPAHTQSAMKWADYSPEALDAALKSKQPVLIDFTAEWCAACHELDEKTFSKDSVASATEKFVKLRVDATKDTPLSTDAQKKFAVKGLPTVIIIDHNGIVRSELTVTGFEPAEVFLKKLERLTH